MSSPPGTRALREALLRFYRSHRRDLPWRRTRDPWAVWVSEVMLQQTRVETVRPRFVELLRRFPTVADLAAVDETEVCEAWAGLGYYRRARNLHAAARRIIEERNGELPDTAATWQTLPGVGRYTAGAIASICHDEEAPVVDGNVARVFSRLHALSGPVRENEEQLWRFAGELVAGQAPGDLNQALMELGATICTPRAPGCGRCPIRRWCAGYRQGKPTRYPAAPLPVPKKSLRVAFAWLETKSGLWLAQRPLTGLWPGLWELPSDIGHGAKRRLSQRLRIPLREPLVRVEHTLSHRLVAATAYRASSFTNRRATATMRPWADPLGAPLSGLARKVIRAVASSR